MMHIVIKKSSTLIRKLDNCKDREVADIMTKLLLDKNVSSIILNEEEFKQYKEFLGGQQPLCLKA